LPLTRGAFSIHLVVDEEGAEGDGFARAGGDLPGERRYLALLQSETGAVAARMTLQLPSEDLAPLLEEEEGLSGPQLEARWEAARRDLETLAAAPQHFPRLVLPAGEEASAVADLLPPMFFCPVPQRFFAVPCPACLGALRTCRDDSLLAGADLPLYSASSTRLLYCPAGHEDDEPTRFYFVEGDVPEELAGKGVSPLSDLRQQLAAALDRRAESEEAVPAESLPCASCPEAGPCLGAGDGGKGATAKAPKVPTAPRWALFNRHDSPFLVTQPSGEPFESLLDRLGGRPLDGDRSPDLGLLFSPAGSGVDAVEILTLKLAAFRQLCRAVGQYYRILGQHECQEIISIDEYAKKRLSLFKIFIIIDGYSFNYFDRPQARIRHRDPAPPVLFEAPLQLAGGASLLPARPPAGRVRVRAPGAGRRAERGLADRRQPVRPGRDLPDADASGLAGAHLGERQSGGREPHHGRPTAARGTGGRGP
jgi:hypothetical protein